ncbi:hypothetical protein LH144_004627, partial [Salmonella enterica]|nr:hypothetical protein [Salmonella enterica]
VGVLSLVMLSPLSPVSEFSVSAPVVDAGGVESMVSEPLVGVDVFPAASFACTV